MELFQTFSLRLEFPMHVMAGGPMYIDFEKGWKLKLPDLSVAVPMKMGERFEWKDNEKGKMKEAK